MPRGRERAHVGADLGDHGLGGGRCQPRHLLQPLDDVTKGRQRGLDAGVEGGNAVLQLLDRPQMLTKQEPMMLADTAVRASTSAARVQPSRSLPSAASFSASVSPAIIAFKMRRPLAPNDVRDHRTQLDVRLLQNRLDALGVLHDLARQLLPRPGQIAQLLDRRRRHEACPDQTMRQQVRKPSRVVHVTLAAGHVLHVRGIRQDQRETALPECARPASSTRLSLPSPRACIPHAPATPQAPRIPASLSENGAPRRPTFRLLTRRRQATTSALCTSRPAHLLCNVFIATSLKARPA